MEGLAVVRVALLVVPLLKQAVLVVLIATVKLSAAVGAVCHSRYVSC